MARTVSKSPILNPSTYVVSRARIPSDSIGSETSAGSFAKSRKRTPPPWSADFAAASPQVSKEKNRKAHLLTPLTKSPPIPPSSFKKKNKITTKHHHIL